jgi:hypothetical protein
MTPKPQIIVPWDASKEDMRRILLKVLPGIIQRTPGATPLDLRAVPELVDAIVFAAYECGDAPELRDMAYQTLSTRPTPEQCNKLIESIRGLVDIRFADLKDVPMQRRTHAFKTWVGKMWLDLVTAFGGDVSVDHVTGNSADIRG